MCIRKVVILIAFERSVCLSISCYYMRFLCVCLSLSFCTCVCLFLRLSFHLKCCARVRLYYNRVPNSGETVESVLVKNDDNSRILCLSFAVVFVRVRCDCSVCIFVSSWLFFESSDFDGKDDFFLQFFFFSILVFEWR